MTDRHARRAKLICTIGPASVERVDALVDAGMDVARINVSHGTAASHRAAAAAVRHAAVRAGRPIAVLVDLAGPKVRLGTFAGGPVELVAGSTFTLRASNGKGAGHGDESGAGVSDRRLASDVRVGDTVYLSDGAVELRVIEADADADVRTEVVRGGTVRSRAGVVIPASRSSAPALTREDRSDLRRLAELHATYVGMSFVRAASDIVELRRALGAGGPAIVAKIETRPAVESFDAILEVADAVMIARGDLGVEVPYEEVPLIQKRLVRHALDRGVPSIVATQMLESMTAAPRPTRAETSDVANAVFDGADAIMLSGETAIGAYPVEAAAAATRIVARCEVDGEVYLPAATGRPPSTDGDAVAVAAAALASAHDDISAICCYTRTGRTARLLSALRPRVPIVAFSPDPDVVARLALVNAVIPRGAPDIETDDRVGPLVRWVGESMLVEADAPVVLVTSDDAPGSAPNVLGIHRVRDRQGGR